MENFWAKIAEKSRKQSITLAQTAAYFHVAITIKYYFEITHVFFPVSCYNSAKKNVTVT